VSYLHCSVADDPISRHARRHLVTSSLAFSPPSSYPSLFNNIQLAYTTHSLWTVCPSRYGHCQPQSCKNWPNLFLGRTSYKVIKHGFSFYVYSVSQYLSVYWWISFFLLCYIKFLLYHAKWLAGITSLKWPVLDLRVKWNVKISTYQSVNQPSISHILKCTHYWPFSSINRVLIWLVIAHFATFSCNKTWHTDYRVHWYQLIFPPHSSCVHTLPENTSALTPVPLTNADRCLCLQVWKGS